MADESSIAPAEAEAVRILYRREIGLAEDAAVTVPPEDFARLHAQVEARREAIESSALEMLNRATREGRRYPRRHQRFALAVIAVIGLIVLIGVLISAFINR